MTRLTPHGLPYRTLEEVRVGLATVPANTAGRKKMARLMVKFGYLEDDALEYAEGIAGIRRESV